uniref:Coiled-coil domain containing 191 n=1 Tax=Denticeps clupeoides TaxID=299321 RepID=A0AAY4DRD9_9TELE
MWKFVFITAHSQIPCILLSVSPLSSFPRSFEELLKEERTCWQQVCAFQKKIETWSFASKPGAALPRGPSSAVLKAGLPPEVSALETFLQQTGGQHGGWDQYDHQSFLKLWTRHGGKASYRREAALHLPHRTEEEVRLHEDWFLMLRELQEKKREVTRNSSSTSIIQTCRQKEKQNQREHRRQEVEDQKMKEELERRRKAQEERRKQAEVKLAVQAHCQQRKEQEEQRLLEKEARDHVEMEERRREASQLIQHFQERVSAEAHISRDPARLWRPTKGWEERLKDIGPTGGGPVLQMFHRAVPSWRQGL